MKNVKHMKYSKHFKRVFNSLERVVNYTLDKMFWIFEELIELASFCQMIC